MQNTTTISRYEVWFPKDPSQRMLWPTTIKLSAEFFDSLQAHALPLDPRAIKALQASAMSLDVYAWLAHRLCRIPDGNPVSISWFALKRQFGPDYGEIRKFRQDFKETLTKVRLVYRDARIEFDSNGILQLRQSRPPVSKVAIRGN